MEQPTQTQLDALAAFAAAHGRTWKASLREAWMSGNYPAACDSASLQQLRNTLGPSWLVKFKLAAAPAPEVLGYRLPLDTLLAAAEPDTRPDSINRHNNVFNYLTAEQFVAENRRDFTRSRDLLDAQRLLEAARHGREAQWIKRQREFVGRNSSHLLAIEILRAYRGSHPRIADAEAELS